MNTLSWRVAVLTVVLMPLPAWPFELATHAAITEQTVSRFVRERPTTFAELGFSENSPGPTLYIQIGDQYVDLLGSLDVMGKKRSYFAFEREIIRRVNSAIEPWSPMGWAMAGAIREDDVVPPFGTNPQDDRYGNFSRVVNHFFDPARNRQLNPCPPGSSCESAPNWATGAVDAFIQPNLVNSGRRNHFTVVDAKETLFRALTLKTLSSGGSWIDLPQPVDANGKETLRNEYWATMFRSLGDILHLLQDMAQPQHTRNDVHAGIVPGTGHKSAFELYVDARAKRVASFRIDTYSYTATQTVRIASKKLPFQVCDASGSACIDYPTPTEFTQYGEFWSTNPGNSVGGKGLADYSNTQFFSAGKNFRNVDYASPPSDVALYTIAPIAPTHWDGSPITGPFNFGPIYLFNRGYVLDNLNLNFGATGVPLTSYSLWNEFVQARAGTAEFSLTRENYDAQADLLLPRAVAYGVGLLRQFFRGSLEISLPDAGAYAVVDHASQNCKDSCGFREVVLKLKNSTPIDAMGPGSFFAVVKFRRNSCYVSDLSGDPGAPSFAGYSCRSGNEEIIVSDPVFQWKLPNGSLGAGEQQPVEFWFPTPIPINATDIYLQVVFRGQLGNESDAVVVTTKNISEPNYIAFVNDLDYQYNPATDTFVPVVPNANITQIDIKLGNATLPVATLAQLDVRGYAQLAFLTDLGSGGTEKLVVDFRLPGAGSPLTYDFPIAAFDSPGGTIYQRSRNVTRYRGMWSDYRIDFFQGSPYSMALCLPQDARRICTSAGLTPITPANAVAWTINFP